MKVTGYRIRSALQRWTLKRDAAAAQFNGTLHAFDGEKKARPTDVSLAIEEAENAIALLQVWQARYNLLVQVKIPGGTIPLALAVKQHGATERAFKRWASASRPKKEKYAYVSGGEKTERSKDTTVADRVVSFEQAGAIAADFAQARSAFTEAIAGGNAQEVELDGFPESLL